MAAYIPPRLRRLHTLYMDPQSEIFLTKNLDRLLQFTKRDPGLNSLTRSEILAYQMRLSDLSRDRETRILRARRRVLSYRKWRTFSPNHICMFVFRQ